MAPEETGSTRSAVVAVVALGYRGMRRAARRHATADLVEPVSSGATGS